MNKLNEFNELYKPVIQPLLYNTLFDIVNSKMNSLQNIKNQYIQLISQLTHSPIITDEEFINKVNEISKIGTIIVCYIDPKNI